MEIIKKILLIVFLLGVILFVGTSVYIHNNGKALVEERLSSALQKEVHVGKARLLFPLGLRFDNIVIKDALTAKVLRVHLGLPLFFGGHFNIAKIKLTEPVFFITYTTDKKIVWGKLDPVDPAAPPATATSAVASISMPAASKPKASQALIMDYLEVANGQVELFDQQRNYVMDIGRINLRAMEIPLPARDMKTKFDVSAVMLTDNAPFAGQKMEARGMINVTARDMDASIKMLDPSGNSGFSAHFKSVHNDMTVKGKINVQRFMSGIRTKEAKESSLEGLLANALQSSGVDIGVDFTCQTKMDDFNCDKFGMSGNVVQNDKKQ